MRRGKRGEGVGGRWMFRCILFCEPPPIARREGGVG